MSSEASLNIENAWQSVALEERIELISVAQAHGIKAALACMLVTFSIAYGRDEIFLLPFGLMMAFLLVPIYASRCWRSRKPQIIMSYLAARSVARRYGFVFRIKDLDILLIFKGTITPIYKDAEERRARLEMQDIDLESSPGSEKKECWIALLRGAVVAFSEDVGGANLEFLTPINEKTAVRKATSEEGGGLIVDGCGRVEFGRVRFSSRYQAALYVFLKKLEVLIKNAEDEARLPPGIS